MEKTLREILSEVEKQAVTDALKSVGGNRSEAARRLGCSRRNILNLILKHDIEVQCEERYRKSASVRVAEFIATEKGRAK